MASVDSWISGFAFTRLGSTGSLGNSSATGTLLYKTMPERIWRGSKTKLAVSSPNTGGQEALPRCIYYGYFEKDRGIRVIHLAPAVLFLSLFQVRYATVSHGSQAVFHSVNDGLSFVGSCRLQRLHKYVSPK